MKKAVIVVLSACLACGLSALAVAGGESDAPKPTPARDVGAVAADAGAAAVAEARLRSQLLHETIHGALQVMHRDFFRDGGDRLPIPSQSLEDVFAELERTWHVNVKWLAVNAKVMNIKNRPKTEFDKAAAAAIAGGSEMYEASADGVYRYAGKITLGNQCLKCHVPQRTSLEDRMAAVVISMPLKHAEPAGK